jgi:hypothetical protein
MFGSEGILHVTALQTPINQEDSRANMSIKDIKKVKHVILKKND